MTNSSEGNTKSKLDNMEPSMVVCISLTCPSRSATIPTINSVALPKVTLSNPPIPGPTFLLNSSVAKLNNAAKGMRAKKFVANTIVEDHSNAPDMSAKGRKISRMLI